MITHRYRQDLLVPHLNFPINLQTKRPCCTLFTIRSALSLVPTSDTMTKTERRERDVMSLCLQCEHPDIMR